MSGFRKRQAILCALMMAMFAFMITPAPARAGDGDNYPEEWKNQPLGAMYDTWGEATRYCTSWVAWALHDRNKYELPFHGHAKDFGPKATAANITVDKNPASGAVAWWEGQSWNGGYGHIAYVESVNTDSMGKIVDVTISEYNNPAGSGTYGTRRITASAPSGYIHFKDIASPTSSSPYADGTFLQSKTTGLFYRMVGGAPVWLPRPSVVPGCCGNARQVEQSVITAMPAHPRNGTVISIAEAGGSGVYRFVGGAPVRLFNWGVIADCCGNVVTIGIDSLAQSDHMMARPKDGSVISIAEAGGSGIYRFVGGAPIRLYNWGVIADCCGSVVWVNAQSLAVLDHMNAVPANGAVISIAEAGGAGLYRFVGGAPVRLFNWGVIPGCCGMVVSVNEQSLAMHDHMQSRPSDGVFLAATESGIVYRVAGGAALRLYNWGGIPSCCDTMVMVNQQTIDTNDHLNSMPSDGTILKGVPSQTYWRIAGRQRYVTTAVPTAVIVDDQTLAAFSLGT